MVLSVLDPGPRRFNDIKWSLEDVSQESLTQTLRLQRNGLIDRPAPASSPVAVQYSHSELGRSLLVPSLALGGPMLEHLPKSRPHARGTTSGRTESGCGHARPVHSRWLR